jgi:uncharacterized protein YbjT (DUF2867 family)
MKYVIMGSAGHISKPLAEKLLAKGNDVTVVSRSEKNIASLIAKNAKAAIGSVEDVNFLTKTFTGADAVYTMVPPIMAATDWKGWIAQIGRNYAAAINASGVKYVVNLSSIGAHLAEGCGPVSGIHFAEEAINTLNNVNIKNLRPGYFYNNLLTNISMIKNLGIMGANFGDADSKVILASPSDIAEVASEELSKLNFTGHTIRYIASDEKTTDEIAAVFGKAIGKPDLKWMVFSDEDALKGMIQAGLPEEIAKNYQEMNQSIRSGIMFEDYWKNHPAILQKIKLEEFAKIFAAAYSGESEVVLH